MHLIDGSQKWLGHACALLALFCFLVSTAALGQGQQYRFQSWTMTSGLPDDSIQAMHRTRDGYLWFTTSEGLVRWDGVRFQVFDTSNTPALRSDRYTFSALLEDSSGALWVGTSDEGVARFKDGVFTPYGMREGLPSNAVSRIDEDAQGNVWIFTSAGLTRWREGRLVRIGEPPGMSARDLQAAFPVSMGQDSVYWGLWRGTDRGVERFASGQWRFFPTPPGIDIRRMIVQSIYEDVRGRIWYSIRGKDDEYYEVEGGALTVFHGVPHGYFVCWQDDEGALWMTDHRAHGGVLRDGHLQLLPEFSTPYIFNVIPGGRGELWIGTVSGGLLRVQRNLATTLRQAGSPEVAASFLLDRRETLWVLSTAIEQMRNNPNDRLRRAASLLPKTKDFLVYTAAFEDPDGRILIANQRELVSVTGSRATVIHSLVDDAMGWIFGLCGDGHGGVWLAGNGLLHITEKGSKKLSGPEGRPVSSVWSMIPDGPGRYLVATVAGLSHLSTTGAPRWTIDPRWKGGPVTSLLRGSDGVVWIGTSRSGLFVMRDGIISPVAPTLADLLGKAVAPLLEEQGYLWFGCANHLVRMRRDDLEHAPGATADPARSLILDERSGYPALHQMDFGAQHFLRYQEKMLIGTQDAVLVLKPSALQLDQSPVHVAIEESSVDNSTSSPAREVEVRPGQTSLQIQYTGLRDNDPETLRFRYRLRGLDDRWSDVGTRRVAYFSHLPAGRYSFQVQATAADGKRSDGIASLAVIVLPHFYERIMFRVVVILAGVLLTVFLVQRRHYRLLHEQAVQRAFSRQLMNSQESERRRIAAELHDSLGQHMVLIKNLSLLGSAQPGGANGSGNTLYAQIGEQSSEALRELRAISYDLRPYHLGRLGLTRAIAALAQQVAASFPGSIVTQLENIDGDIPLDLEIAFYRIVQECLGNMLKHSEAASVTIRISKQKNRIMLSFEDDGRGLPSAPNASGFGMIGMRERAIALGGEIAIENAPEGGTVVRLTVPIERAPG